MHEARTSKGRVPGLKRDNPFACRTPLPAITLWAYCHLTPQILNYLSEANHGATGEPNLLQPGENLLGRSQ